MAEFVNHHIVLDHKIDSKRTSKTIKKNILANGNCTSPKRSTQAGAFYALVILLVFFILANSSSLWLIVGAPLMLGLTTLCGYNVHQALKARPLMTAGSPVIICLGSDISSTLSAVPWAETSGLSSAWASFTTDCRIYEGLLEKIPEGELVSDQMFFSTVEDIYILFEHTYNTSQSISRHRMEREFNTINEAITRFGKFVSQSSEIYASLRLSSTGERINSIGSNLDHMNEVAFSKISSLRELANPHSNKSVKSVTHKASQPKEEVQVNSIDGLVKTIRF